MPMLSRISVVKVSKFVSEFVSKVTNNNHASPIRAANILSAFGCVFPFLLPYFVPVILMVNISGTAAEYGVGSVTALEAGLFNFVSWGILVMVIVYIFRAKHGND